MSRLRAAISAMVLLTVTSCWFISSTLAATKGPQVDFDASSAEPRSIEDATRSAITRDYSTAWQNLATAMVQNRTDVLDASFVGLARDKFVQGITTQKKAGLHRRYTDRGHRLEAVFYSYDGSALQLKDTAQVEIELLDGEKVVAVEPATIHYIVLLTPAENSWKIRDMEAVPSF